MASRFETFPEDEICAIKAKKATNFGFSVFIACERRLPGSGYILKSEASRYLALLTDPEGDSCFSIYQISWIKLKKVTFCKLYTSLGRNFVYNLQTFRRFCQVHFTVLLQIQHENNFLPNQ